MGRQISMFEAVHKYKVHRFTLMKWFKLGLPYSRTEGGHYKIDADEIDKFLAEKKHLARNRILIVDSDAKFLKWISRQAESAGYDALVSENPIDGLIQIKTFRPNLVVLNYSFSKDADFDAVEKIRSDPDLAKIPILCVSDGRNASDIIDKSAKIRCVGFLKKPFSEEELERKLDEIFLSLSRIS